MVKAKVTRKRKVSKKDKTVKKTKAKQIIKQKVVINLDRGTKRRGRPRKAAAQRQEAVQPGQTIKTDFTTQNQFYDQLRASTPYVEEIKEDVKRLEDGQSNAMNTLMGMQQAGLMLQMQQGQLQRQLENRPRVVEENNPPVSRLLPSLQLSTDTPKKGRGGARVGAGRPKGIKNKPKEGASLGPTMEERLRSETANLRREMETQTEPAAPPPASPVVAPPTTPVAPGKPKRGGAKEKKGK